MIINPRKVIHVEKHLPHENNIWYNIKQSTVECIEYHQPMGDGDAHYCDILHTDGKITRFFRPDEIVFDK